MKRFLSLLFLFSLLFSFPLSASAEDDHAVKKIHTSKKLIALTFDDGPHPEYTAEILDILKEYNQKATFFVVGQNVKEYPEILRRTVAEGHEIGGHTYSHRYINRMCDEEFLQDLKKTDEAILSVAGIVPKLMRPPGGGYNDHCLCLLENTGKTCILWNRDTRDWQCIPAATILSKLERSLEPGDIILFHDFNRRGSPTAEVLRTLIPAMLEEGYSFVTVSELLAAEEAD